MTEAFCENPCCPAYGLSLIVTDIPERYCRKCGGLMTVVEEEEEG